MQAQEDQVEERRGAEEERAQEEHRRQLLQRVTQRLKGKESAMLAGAFSGWRGNAAELREQRARLTLMMQRMRNSQLAAAFDRWEVRALQASHNATDDAAHEAQSARGRARPLGGASACGPHQGFYLTVADASGTGRIRFWGWRTVGRLSGSWTKSH